MSSDFDRWACGYEQSPLQPIFQAAHEAAISQADRLCWCPRRILDIGCGTGRLLRSASAVFPAATLVGLDPSRKMLLGADPTRPIALTQARAERLPFVEGSFDLVLATSSYRHWSDPRAALRDIRRVLSPLGWLVLADVFSASRRLFRTGRPNPLPTGLRAALAEADLAAAEVEVVPGYGPIPSITTLAAHPTRHPRDAASADLVIPIEVPGPRTRFVIDAIATVLTTPTRPR
jgi:ubiquinone/menaquinone biosynthesis C-methylase UbiE